MVSGHLQEKKGNYYIVLNYKDRFGKRKSKWIPTDLPVKGNKKRAEALLMEARRSFTPEEQTPPEELLFSDFLLNWLKIIRPSLSETTYATYYGNATKIIIPSEIQGLAGLAACAKTVFDTEDPKVTITQTVPKQ